MLLRNKETDIPPAVRIEEAHLEEINRRNVIIVAVENTAANYLSKATLAYEVFHDGQATAIKGKRDPISAQCINELRTAIRWKRTAIRRV